MSAVARLVAVFILVVVAALPVAANEIVEPVPAPDTIMIPSRPFLDRADAKQDFFDSLVARVRDFRRYMRRQVKQFDVALGDEEAPIVHPEKVDESAILRDADLQVTEPLDDAAPTRDASDARGIGVHDAALIGLDAPQSSGLGTTARTGFAGPASSGSPAPVPGEVQRFDPLRYLFEALDWMRREPLVTALIVFGLALLGWTRAVAQRG